MTANKFIAEIDAPEFGEGFTIRLDMHGQGQLETRFGDFVFAEKVHYGLAVMSSKYIEAFLEVALRKDGEVSSAVNGALDGPLMPVAKKCEDAFCLFRYGMSAEAWREESERRRAEGERGAVPRNPPKGPKPRS